MADSFTWQDAERLIRFGEGVLGEAPELLSERGFDKATLLTTERAAESLPGLASGFKQVLHVPDGLVDELAAGLLDEAGGKPLVALGGGRVIDTAKAIAGVGEDVAVAAVPTTLSGAPMTPFHRTPAGADGARWVRPALVIADPVLMTSQPLTQRAASAMNALAHAMESLYMPLANPVSELAGLHAAWLIAQELPGEEPAAEPLALAALLAGYAVGLTGLGVHHAVCQTIVRVAGAPHAETNAVMLPYFARLMAMRAPGKLGELARALGDPVGDAGAAGGRIAKLAGRSGHTRLSTLGVEEKQLKQVVKDVKSHPGLAATPDPPSDDELLRLLQSAL